MPGSWYGQQPFVWRNKVVKHLYRLFNRRQRVLFPADHQNWELDGTNLIPMGGFQPGGKSGFQVLQELTDRFSGSREGKSLPDIPNFLHGQ